MNEPLIKVDNLSKKFCRSLKKSLWYGMQDLGREVTGRRHGHYGELRKDEFWAINDISFELKRGECLGLIGHNGAGKTTLLRTLNGLIKPDGGRVEMRGSVGALIALGAGFNPILTGRENVYVNASVLGLSKKLVDSRIDEVIEFSEIGEFIDSPVQNYSSGMQVRLGFSVAAILIKPDILFLDEVLAVGDIGFVIKCLNVVRSITQNASVVFVSHNMQFISSFCTRVIIMEKGAVTLDTNKIGTAIEKYYSMIKNTENNSGSGKAEIHDFKLEISGGIYEKGISAINYGDTVNIRMKFSVDNDISGVYVMVYIHDESMAPIICYPIKNENNQIKYFDNGLNEITIPLGKIDLNAGRYTFVVTITDKDSSIILRRSQGLNTFTVVNDIKYWGCLVRPAVPL